MSDSFNGYHVWLGIPPSEQPPNHYRLLGIAFFETDLDVIDHAADRQMAHVRTFQSGRNAALSQRILNELAAARVCLLNPQRKAEYDSELRAKLAAVSQVAAVPVGKAVPVAQPATIATSQPTPSPPPPARSHEPRHVPIDADDPYEVELVDTAPLASRVDEIDDDFSAVGEPSATGPKIRVGGGRRSVSRDASFQRAMVYIFVGVAILIVIMVLFNVLRRLAGPSGLQEMFTVPGSSAPADPGSIETTPKPPAPAAPAPAPPGRSVPADR